MQHVVSLISITLCIYVPSAIYFSFNHTLTTLIYTLSLHDALPISASFTVCLDECIDFIDLSVGNNISSWDWAFNGADRKSTRLNSSHVAISYAVFCLKKTTSTV